MKPSGDTATQPHLECSLPKAAYCGPAHYRRECEAIFWDQWFYVGRADRLTDLGSYRVVEVAGESVIVIRAQEGLRAHLNLCRHRGSRLLCGEGEQRGAIRCPYHAWAYSLDGELLASPFVEAADVPPAARRLHRVGLAQWGGFLFVHLSPERAEREGQTLGAQLGPIPARLARYPLEALQTVHTIRYEVAANWKVLLENYNECYHCANVHPELCRVVPAFKQNGGANLEWERGVPHRDGAWTFTQSGTSARAPFPGLNEDERVRHKGELIYPNFMLSLCADHVAAYSLWPQGPEKTEVVCDFLFHPEATSSPGFDHADATAFWDLVNRQDWRICESVQDGMRSRAFRFGYYAPMEDASLDIRRYIASRLGEDAVALGEGSR